MDRFKMKRTPESEFIKQLKNYIKYLTKSEFSTLKGQAISGNICGSRKGLLKLLRRQGIEASISSN